MTEGLGKVSDQLVTRRIDFLGEQPDIVDQPGGNLKRLSGTW